MVVEAKLCLAPTTATPSSPYTKDIAMQLTIAVLFATLAAAPEPESLERQFPPDVWANTPIVNRPTRQCVHPNPQTGAIAVRPCPPTEPVRLLPPLQLLPEPAPEPRREG